ncbi:MAG: hypothetical protein ACLFR2_12805 [Candidatus Kapaibacterium sp.]
MKKNFTYFLRPFALLLLAAFLNVSTVQIWHHHSHCDDGCDTSAGHSSITRYASEKSSLTCSLCKALTNLIKIYVPIEFQSNLFTEKGQSLFEELINSISAKKQFSYKIRPPPTAM